MLSLFQPSIYLTLLAVLHHLPTAFPADRIMDDTAWRRQSFHQTLTLLACRDHLAPDVVLCVLKIMILNYSLCY